MNPGGSKQTEAEFPFPLEHSIKHAWDWFALHANQRMQGVNFFLLAAAFLSTAYVGAMQHDKLEVAGGVATLGVWFCIVFYIFELRIRELIKVGETALARSQQKLAQMTGFHEFEICTLVEKPRRIFTSYHKVISALYLFTGVAFLAGGAYALHTPIHQLGTSGASVSLVLYKIVIVLAALLSLFWAQRVVTKSAGSRDWLNRFIAVVLALGGTVVLVLCARGI
jgi:hypothetical protein